MLLQILLKCMHQIEFLSQLEKKKVPLYKKAQIHVYILLINHGYTEICSNQTHNHFLRQIFNIMHTSSNVLPCS